MTAAFAPPLLTTPPPAVEFVPFPKIARLNRPIVITEKIDGSNAAISIPEDDGPLWTQSRKRVIYPGKGTDLQGFAGWVQANEPELRGALGPGLHFGEWYGRGIQRGYGIEPEQGADGKFFALFNTGRWREEDEPYPIGPAVATSTVPGLTVTPVLAVLPTFSTGAIAGVLNLLREFGSRVAGGEGFDHPEGVVVFHKQGNVMFKVTLEDDERGKDYGG